MKATPQEVPYVPIYDYDGQIASNFQPLTSNFQLLRRRLLGRRVKTSIRNKHFGGFSLSPLYDKIG
jgi:hypothetical protein